MTQQPTRTQATRVSNTPILSQRDALSRIIALCTNPHWSGNRKYRIADIAQEALQLLSATEAATSPTTQSELET